MRRLNAVLLGSLLVIASCASDGDSTSSTGAASTDPASPAEDTTPENTPDTEPPSSEPPPSDTAAETVPTPVMVGTNDRTTPIEPHVRRAWELVSGRPHYRLELVDAQHNTFTELCAYLESFPTLPDVNELVLQTIEQSAAEGCSAGDMPISRARELTNTFAISFLDSIFKGGEMIEPDADALPDDINYQAKWSR